MKPFLAALALASSLHAAPFPIKEGDRVLLLGDALLERENNFGLLETRMHQAFPQARFSVRNLSWSGETPKGWSRASFDAPAKGWDRLKENIATVQPTVAVLGFGMAATLQEITDRSGDHMLNPDPVRYGAEPMSAARFKKEMAELMDAIQAASGTTPVRFVLLAPIAHEDLRKLRPGLPDPTAHNALLAEYTKALEALAQERQAAFCPADPKQGIQTLAPWNATHNGIALTEMGYGAWANDVAKRLEWPAPGEKINVTAVRAAVLRKNDLFFHQFRPANSTYLFGFRKHEQGRNAAEMPKFTPIIEGVDAEIDGMKRGKEPAAVKPAETAQRATPAPLPIPNFTVVDGMELTLWADTHLVGKPVGMNWDAAGRLWVACSPVYPQISPGAHPDDKVVVIEDTDRDGKADKSTTFASDLLIAAGVAPDFQNTPKAQAPETPTAAYVGASTELIRAVDTDGDGKADERRVVLSGFGTEDTHHTIHTLRWGPDGRLNFNQSIYIHSHMETPWGMVRLNSGGVCAYDPNTERVEVTARGFINTWGHAWDRWGQEFATDGAGFEGLHWLVPGAMFRTYEGARRILPSISPGSYPKYSGLELIQSPLFPADWQGDAITCDFRAHRIVRFKTTDLAAPKTVAGKATEAAKSGYQASELPAPVVTTDAAFRPIDVKLGPDGALYIADWTNPIINHGEVDFRDPRRDHVNGRIWRLAPKGSTPLKWENLSSKKTDELLALASPALDSAGEEVTLPPGKKSEPAAPANQWAVDNARRVLLSRPAETRAEMQAVARTGIGSSLQVVASSTHLLLALGDAASAATPVTQPDSRALALLAQTLKRLEQIEKPSVVSLLAKQNGEVLARLYTIKTKPAERAAVVRQALALLGGYAQAETPRVRIEAMRALARIPSMESAALVLEAALKTPGGNGLKSAKSEEKGTSQFNQPTFTDAADPFYGYAAWLSVNDLAPQVMSWVEQKATSDAPSNPQQDAMISYALQSLRADQTSALLAKIIAKRGVPKDGSGPWIELIGQAGGAKEVGQLYASLLNFSPECCDDLKKQPAWKDVVPFDASTNAAPRAARALVEAARRGVKPASPWPDGGLNAMSLFLDHPNTEVKQTAIALVGLWKLEDQAPMLGAVMDPSVGSAGLTAAFDALRTLGTPKAAKMVESFLNPAITDQHQAMAGAVKSATPEVRMRALVALSALNPPAAITHLPAVLSEQKGDSLPLWRELFQSKSFAEKFGAAVPKDLPQPALAAALRAARELGKKGEALAAALTPLAGETAAPSNPQDFAWLGDFTKKNGNAAEGELIYRRAVLACTVCHAIGGAGGKVGPDLTTIGASAPLDYLVESVMAPAVKVKEGFHAVALTLKGGRSASGVQVRETDRDVILRDAAGTEQAVAKADITARDNIGSLMPPGLTASLTDREKANLFAFLAQLGKPGPFDATKATVARSWELFAGADIEKIASAGAQAPKSPLHALSLVDGRLPKAQLTEALLLLGSTGDTMVLVTRFNNATATPARLRLQGVTKAWLDGAPLAIASDPNPTVELTAGTHVLAIKLDVKTLPEILRAECAEVRFLNE